MEGKPMNRKCTCAKCYHPGCPPTTVTNRPYDELLHEANNNFISVKLPKNAGNFVWKRHEDQQSKDKECHDICKKVNVIENQTVPPKKPEEETFSLRAIKQIMPNDDVRNSLEIEFKAARNYVPLPEQEYHFESGPPTRQFIPVQRAASKKSKKH